MIFSKQYHVSANDSAYRLLKGIRVEIEKRIAQQGCCPKNSFVIFLMQIICIFDKQSAKLNGGAGGASIEENMEIYLHYTRILLQINDLRCK